MKKEIGKTAVEMSDIHKEESLKGMKTMKPPITPEFAAICCGNSYYDGFVEGANFNLKVQPVSVKSTLKNQIEQPSLPEITINSRFFGEILANNHKYLESLESALKIANAVNQVVTLKIVFPPSEIKEGHPEKDVRIEVFPNSNIKNLHEILLHKAVINRCKTELYLKTKELEAIEKEQS